MKILLSAYACEPGRGSEPAVGWNWLLALAEMGHDVSVITRENNIPGIEANRSKSKLKFTTIAYDLPAWCRDFKHWPGGLYVYYLLWQFGAYRRARGIHKRDPFDLVHHITFVTFRQPSFMGGLKIPFIFGPVGGGETSPRPLRAGLSHSGRLREALRDVLIDAVKIDPSMSRAFSKAALIACTTPETLHRIPRRFHSKCTVLPAIGINLMTEPVHRAPSHPRFLFVGRLLYWKGIHLALRAMPEVLRHLPNARLTIIGEGEDAQWLKRVAEDCGVTAHIDWIPHLPYSDITNTYLEHTALVFPSLHDSGGLVVLESLGAQLPVICLDLGGPGTFVDSTCGIVIKTANQSESSLHHTLAAAMINIGNNPEMRAELATNCPARVRRFTWSATARHLYSTFDATSRGAASRVPSASSSDDRMRNHIQAR